MGAGFSRPIERSFVFFVFFVVLIPWRRIARLTSRPNSGCDRVPETLIGSFDPFPLTREDRQRTGDSRRSIGERYTGRDEYARQVRRAAEDLVRQRFMLAADVPAAVQSAQDIWDAIAAGVTR